MATNGTASLLHRLRGDCASLATKTLHRIGAAGGSCCNVEMGMRRMWKRVWKWCGCEKDAREREVLRDAQCVGNYVVVRKGKKKKMKRGR